MKRTHVADTFFPAFVSSDKQTARRSSTYIDGANAVSVRNLILDAFPSASHY